jgi:hypothetical protein
VATPSNPPSCFESKGHELNKDKRCYKPIPVVYSTVIRVGIIIMRGSRPGGSGGALIWLDSRRVFFAVCGD